MTSITRFVPIAVMIAGCATEPAEPQRVVITGDDVVVGPDHLSAPIATHPELDEANPADLVAGIQGGGYVRRIVAIDREGGNYELATEDVPLGEAVGEATSTIRLQESKADGTTQDFALGFSIDHRSLYDRNGIAVEVEHAALAFRPVVDLDWDVSWGQLDRFVIRAGGELDGNITLAARAPTGGSWSFSQTVWRDTMTFVQWFGWVPVVEVVELRAGVGADVHAEGAFDVRVDAGFDSGLTAGVAYENDRWHNIGGARVQRTGSPPTANATGAVSVHSYLFADVRVSLYGIAGPFVSVRPQLSYRRAADGSWTRTVGVAADGGAELVNPFGDDLRYTARLFDLQYPLQ